MNPFSVTKITKKILDFMFFAGIAACLSLPLSLRLIGNYFPHYILFYIPMLVLFFISGILSILIIRELRAMFLTVLNVRGLRRMGTYSFCIAAVSALRLLIVVTPATMVIILVFVIAGLFSKVLSKVFDQAVTYKLENDLTI